MEHNGNHNNEILNILDQLENKYKIIINVIQGSEDGNKSILDTREDVEEAEQKSRREEEVEEEVDVHALT